MSDSSNSSNGSTSNSKESKPRTVAPGERSSGQQTPSGAAKPTETAAGKDTASDPDRATPGDAAGQASAWSAVVDEKKGVPSSGSGSDTAKSGSDPAKDDAPGAGEANQKQKEEKGAHPADAVADRAKSGLSEVTDQAKTAASGMATAASTATEKVQDLAAEAGDELEHVIEERKAEGAHQLHRLAGAIGRAGGELQEEFPFAAGMVERGALRFGKLAETLQERPVRTFASEAGNLVRRRPAAAAGLLGVVGFAAFRFLKATPPDAAVRGRPDEGSEGETTEAVQRSLSGLADESGEKGSGDPRGTSPEAPGFETKSGKGGATRNS